MKLSSGKTVGGMLFADAFVGISDLKDCLQKLIGIRSLNIIIIIITFRKVIIKYFFCIIIIYRSVYDVIRCFTNIITYYCLKL